MAGIQLFKKNETFPNRMTIRGFHGHGKMRDAGAQTRILRRRERNGRGGPGGAVPSPVRKQIIVHVGLIGARHEKKPARDARNQSVAGSKIKKNPLHKIPDTIQTFPGVFVHPLAPCQRSLLPACSNNSKNPIERPVLGNIKKTEPFSGMVYLSRTTHFFTGYRDDRPYC